MNRYLFYGWLCLFLRMSLSVSAEIERSSFDSLYHVASDNLFSRPQKIMELYDIALKIKGVSPIQLAEFHFLYAMSERLQGDYEGSIQALYEAENLLEKGKNNLLRGKIYNLMSSCYCNLTDFTSAFRFNEQATTLFRMENDSSLLASAYNTRGIIHAHLLEYEQADKFLKQALSINRSLNDMKKIAANLNNLCIYEGGNPLEKIEYVKEAIIINKNLGAFWSIAENYNNMGKQYFYAGEYKKALTALDKARVIALEKDAKGLICDNYEYYAMVYNALGKYKEAYDMQVAYSLMNQEIHSVNKLWALERNMVQKRLSEEQRRTELNREKYEVKLWKSRIYIILIALVSMICAALLILQRYRRKKTMELMKAKYSLEQSEYELAKLKVQQQEQQLKGALSALEHSQKEITDIAVFMQSRTELLDVIREQIKEGYKMEGAGLTAHLKKINAFIKQYQVGDKASSSIMKMIDEKSREFLEHLLQKHPDLTQGERHMAILLRVNLVTKDIAMLTGTTPKTVTMNRYRLRKALNLDPEIDLVEYLQSI